MGWIDDLNVMTIWEIFAKAGYKRARGNGLKPCYTCNAEKRGKEDSRGPIGVRGDGNGYKCFSCGTTGDKVDLFTWGIFKARCGDLSEEQMKEAQKKAQELGLSSGQTISHVGKSKVLQLSKRKYEERISSGGSAFSWHDNLVDEAHSRMWATEGKEPEGKKVLEYLIGRGFTWEAIVEFKLGSFKANNQEYLVIPVLDENKKPVNARFRTIEGKKMYLRSPGRPTTLFGVHTLGDKKKPVILTEGELDAIALWQYGYNENIISGTAGAQHWKDEWLDTMEEFKSFIICYDDDKAGNEGAKSVAERLGMYRCSRAILPYNDAADCIKNGVEKQQIVRAFEDSKSLLDISIVRVDKYAHEIEELIRNPQSLRGRPTGSAKFDKAIGGFRDELIIVTGPTGAGKTTFTTWLGWTQGYMGHGVLMTSFEQRPIGTVQKLLRQQLGGDFTIHTEEQRAQAMQQLGSLPIHIVDHYGNITFSEMEDVIKFSIRRKDVKMVIIDHLGFIVDSSAKDERREIERVIRSLATIAVNDGVTIVLICHPNRVWVGQQRRVQISDLKGASAIEQDAHVGLVVERVKEEDAKHPQTRIHADKVRSEFGLMGSTVSLAFDPIACIYADEWLDTPMGFRMRGQSKPVYPER